MLTNDAACASTSPRTQPEQAALQRAVRLLRASELSASYESAWEEWDSARHAEAWNAAAGDGLASGDVPIDARAPREGTG